MAKKGFVTQVDNVKLPLKKEILTKISFPGDPEQDLKKGLPTGFCPEKGVGGLGRLRGPG